MAVDAYLIITPYNGTGATGGFGRPLTTDALVNLTITKDLASVAIQPGTLIEVSDYGFEIEQTLNIGSPTGGAGAGKVSFDAFAITKRLDSVSTTLFQNCAAGTPFAKVDLLLVKTGGAIATAQIYLQHTFKLAAVATITYSDGDNGELERVTFESGDAQVRYATQNPDGTTGKITVAGWNRIKNVADVGTDPI